MYRLQATGAANLHETLICEMTFKAPPGSGVCLTFSSFEIDDCRVSLAIYQEPTAAGKQWVSMGLGFFLIFLLLRSQLYLWGSPFFFYFCVPQLYIRCSPFFFFFCVFQLYLWCSPFFFFFCVPNYISGVHLFWVRCLGMFSNPAIEVATFRLRGWCMLGVFLCVAAFSRLGHMNIRIF